MNPATLYRHPEQHTYLDTTLSDLHHCRILATLMQCFDLRPGDSVVEVGSGSGRYTEWLLNYGLHVTAVEPDPQLMRKLERRLHGASHLRLVGADLASLRGRADDVRAVCGFHVLHHLNQAALLSLADSIRRVADQATQFSGWFFLEPNPWNLFYPLQILTTPGMRFDEEAGIWRNDYQTSLSRVAGGDCTLGTIGLFPPRGALGRLPEWLLGRGTDLRRGRSLVRLYTLYGQRVPR